MSAPPPPSSTSTSDTSFRKTWDRSTYAALASARETSEKATAKARYEAKLQGRKYHPPPSTKPSDPSKPSPSTTFDPSSTDTLSRTARLDVSAHVGKTILVPAGAGATGKRGRGAGFYCEECDLTFKDNLQFVDHLNSRQHLVAVGQSGVVRRATIEEVRERLEMLGERKRVKEMGEGEMDLGKRLEGRRVEEERVKEEKRRRRNERRRKGKGENGVGVGVKVEEGGDDGGIIC